MKSTVFQQGWSILAQSFLLTGSKFIVFGLNQYPSSASVCITYPNPTTSPLLAWTHEHLRLEHLYMNIFWQWAYLFEVVDWTWEQASLWQLSANRLDCQLCSPPPRSRSEIRVCSGSPGSGGIRSDAPHCGTAAPESSSHSTPEGHTVSLYTCVFMDHVAH